MVPDLAAWLAGLAVALTPALGEHADVLPPALQLGALVISLTGASAAGGGLTVRWVLNGMRQDVRETRQEMQETRKEVADVRERMARLEAKLEEMDE